MVNDKRKVKLVCLGCYKGGRNKLANPRRLKKKYDGWVFRNGRVQSKPLMTHLSQNKKCDEYYNRIVEPDLHGMGFDTFFTSRLELLPPPHANRARFTPAEVGLTMAYNYPGQTSTCHIVPPNAIVPLDSQVMYDGSVGHVDRELIQARLLLDDENSINDSSDNFSMSSEADTGDDIAPTPGTSFSIVTSSPGMHFLSDTLLTEIRLLSIMRKHQIPLCVQKEIYDWAYEAQSLPGFNWGGATNPYRSRAKVMKTIIKEALPHLQNDAFEHECIPWLPGGVKQITFRSFENAIRSLLTNTELCKQENLSFPNTDSPLLVDRKPEITPDTPIEELHHGSWWIETWKEKCDPGRKEILVPLIFYMDGISVDTHGKLSLTPLQMSLGIFSTEARKRPDAWETIYFHPSSSDAEPRDNIQNLHNGIEAALKSLKDIWSSNETIEWLNLPWANKSWQVQMRFSIAFFIGDTEMHDKLCGRFGSRTKVKKLCRHCDCPINWSHIPSKNARSLRKLFLPEDVNAMTKSDEALAEISHHPIRNVFHDMDFGVNKHNIHLASPGEKLHMHQLGSAKRAMASFLERFQKSGKGAIKSTIEELARRYGSQLSRQSDRNFPRTKFTSAYLSTVKKEGNDYAGLCLCLLLSLLSRDGSDAMQQKEKARSGTIKNFVLALEQVLGMEEFLKSGSIKFKHVKIIPRIVTHFLNEVNINFYKMDGMGDRSIKKHLYFHYQDYIKLWGSPAGWDSAPSEGHHKTEIKAPSKSTQCNKSTFVDQTASRQLEYRLIDRTMTEYSLQPSVVLRKKKPFAGATYHIGVTDDNRAYMEWDRPEFRGRPGLPQDVLEFVCEHVLPILSNNTQVQCFTEHNRKIGDDGPEFLFRASPSYRSDSGQRNALWYDWAYFFEEAGEVEKLIPCQIMCFLQLKGVTLKANGNFHVVNTYDIEDDGAYAVVRKLTDEPEPHPYSSIVSTGKMGPGLYLLPVDSIEKPAAVVENVGKKDAFFVVGNREEWLTSFVETAESLGSLTNLYEEEDYYPIKYSNPTDPTGE